MSEIKHLLPERKTYFKANLHTHSTCSDGLLTPTELKEAYKSRGYQILALTDHEVCVPHPELNDPDFLALTSYELSVDGPGKCYHLNFIAKDPDNRWQHFCRAQCAWGAVNYIDQVVCDGDMPRQYTTEFVNDLIAKANRKGFLVTYNHPTWSQQSYPDYAGLKGLWGVEVYNHACNCVGYEEYNDRVFQELLTLGNTVYPVAADDFHRYEHGIAGGWIMLGAKDLTYPDVIEAMEKGDFYASTGPEIRSLTLEGTKLKLTCSEAVSVKIRTHIRQAVQLLPENGHTMTKAEFDLAPWLEKWETLENKEQAFIRVTVTDAAGHKALTRAYFLGELL